MPTRSDLEELAALPDGHREQLARDVLESLGVSVKQAHGDELIIPCPVSGYHRDQERNPTAALNSAKWLFHCLGCGARGTVLWLITAVHPEIDTIEQARSWLAARGGLGRAMELPDLLALFDSLYTPKTPAPLPVYSDRMLERWTGIDGYILNDRQIPRTTAEALGICTDPDGWINKERTGPRAVIPHYWKGQLVGWQSRRLPGADPTAPKYLSTPGFPRDETIYHDNPDAEEILVVESPMSVLRHLHHGGLWWVGTFGFVVTDQQIHHLVKGRRKVVFWPDPDEAGWRAMEGITNDRGRFFPGAPQRTSAHCETYIVDSPFDADPADLPDPIVDAVLATRVVPWPIWTRPTQLYCHRCLQPSHKGDCRA